MVCTVEILPVWVSQRLRLPSVSPMMTKWPHAAMAVATPSDELDMRPQEGRFGLVSVTCAGPGVLRHAGRQTKPGEIMHMGPGALCRMLLWWSGVWSADRHHGQPQTENAKGRRDQHTDCVACFGAHNM